MMHMASGRGEQLRILRLTQNYARELEGLNLQFDIPPGPATHATHDPYRPIQIPYRQALKTPSTLAELAATRCHCLRQAGIVGKCPRSQSKRNADARHPRETRLEMELLFCFGRMKMFIPEIRLFKQLNLRK